MEWFGGHRLFWLSNSSANDAPATVAGLIAGRITHQHALQYLSSETQLQLRRFSSETGKACVNAR
ncbi:hypothetical protein ZHAS_00015987 [Anopheles sinensis]|uniref:Uncharacterized protein n=1 Tax=Anopheles sinensis TaxID=74873 RepID=A0A084WCI2_ANOSI|nr:hypothetical protein ZHAS_00015987 [Anopheles sinensis]